MTWLEMPGLEKKSHTHLARWNKGLWHSISNQENLYKRKGYQYKERRWSITNETFKFKPFSKNIIDNLWYYCSKFKQGLFELVGWSVIVWYNFPELVLTARNATNRRIGTTFTSIFYAFHSAGCFSITWHNFELRQIATAEMKCNAHIQWKSENQ